MGGPGFAPADDTGTGAAVVADPADPADPADAPPASALDVLLDGLPLGG